MRTKINIFLGLVVIVFSVLNIVWNHNYRLLTNESRNVQTISRNIVAINKQLLTEYSQKISGVEIQQKAVKLLGMKLPEKTKNIDL